MSRGTTGTGAIIVGMLVATGIAGCGLAETGAAAAVDAKANADAAQAGLQAEAKIRADLDQAAKAAAAQRQAVDE